MAGKNNGLDAIMAMMALKTLMNDTKDLAIHPFTIEVTVTCLLYTSPSPRDS
mgnify:CR=1 FL=1